MPDPVPELMVEKVAAALWASDLAITPDDPAAAWANADPEIRAGRREQARLALAVAFVGADLEADWVVHATGPVTGEPKVLDGESRSWAVRNAREYANATGYAEVHRRWRVTFTAPVMRLWGDRR